MSNQKNQDRNHKSFTLIL